MMQVPTPLSELRMHVQTPFSETSSSAYSNRLVISSQMSARAYRDDAGSALGSGRRSTAGSMQGVREDVMRDLLMFLESTPASR